jgi:hypothetical protein
MSFIVTIAGVLAAMAYFIGDAWTQGGPPGVMA